MSSDSSPTHYPGETNRIFDPNYTAEISQKMRVPKRINVDGVSDEPNVSRPESHWLPAEKLEMFVPDKIIVTGVNEYQSARQYSREALLNGDIMPPDPGINRVQNQGDYDYPLSPVSKEQALRKFVDDERRNDVSTISLLNESTSVEGMTMGEEVVHLRRQLAKLNRRVMSIELDNLQRQNRDKMIYACGLAYFFFKTMLWLSRS